MSARFYADMALVPGQTVTLPDATARHVQVLRLQPGDAITLFNGLGDGQGSTEGEFEASVSRMGRSDVDVTIGRYTATAREAARAIHLVVSMPANDRMDWLVEKATELGAASIQPVMSERSVLRLKAERADKKVAHWRGIATAASEQCGRNRLPLIHDVMLLSDWLKRLPLPAADSAAAAAQTGARLLLSLQGGSQPLAQAVALFDAIDAPAAHDASQASQTNESPAPRALTFLNGPEGGLSPAEEAAALACGFRPVTLGPRVLRAETAPLACLALLTLTSDNS